MDETITATEANRHFAEVLRKVREGSAVTVTVHGEPVADIIPHRSSLSKEEREQRRQAFFDRLLQLPTQNIGPWTRDELYDDEEPGPG